MPLPLLKATGQTGKLALAGAGIFGGLVAVFLAGYLPFEAGVALYLAGAGAIVGGAVYALRAVRCPQCGLSWTRWTLRHQPYDKWLIWLYTFDACPQCGLTKDQTHG